MFIINATNEITWWDLNYLHDIALSSGSLIIKFGSWEAKLMVIHIITPRACARGWCIIWTRANVEHAVLIVTGCFCPDGYVERGNSCVTPKECDADLCSLPPKTGPCFAYFRRYFYNTTSKQCERFVYGGCRGNENNFETVEECEAKCNGERPQYHTLIWSY